MKRLFNRKTKRMPKYACPKCGAPYCQLMGLYWHLKKCEGRRKVSPPRYKQEGAGA
jgi:lipopolysaccharide biosynthesis regulator YciM